jgi:hypothetical protein
LIDTIPAWADRQPISLRVKGSEAGRKEGRKEGSLDVGVVG